MVSFFLLTILLLSLDVACGDHHCSQPKHITKKEDWSDDPPITYKAGKQTAQVPLARTHPFHSGTEAEINKQINWELFAHYTYLSMAYHFNRDDINLPGFHKFFKESAEEEMKHAQKLMEYQNKRGGRVKLHSIMKPCEDQWGSGLDAMNTSLQLEKDVYQSLLDLHTFASSQNDPQLTDFLESHYLEEQVESIKELSNYVNTLTRLQGPNYALGEYQFDKITLEGGKSE